MRGTAIYRHSDPRTHTYADRCAHAYARANTVSIAHPASADEYAAAYSERYTDAYNAACYEYPFNHRNPIPDPNHYGRARANTNFIADALRDARDSINDTFTNIARRANAIDVDSREIG